MIEGCDSRVWGRARRRASFSPNHRPFAFSLYSTVGMGVSLLVRARCACRRLFRTEASLSMLSPRLASAAHPCTRPGCRLQHNRFPGQPCACVACLSASLLAQARGWYVPSGFSDYSAAGSAAPSRQTARCPCTGADRKSQAVFWMAAATKAATMSARMPGGCVDPQRSPLVAQSVRRGLRGCCMSGRMWSRCMSGSCRCERADVLRRPLAHRARTFFA